MTDPVISPLELHVTRTATAVHTVALHGDLDHDTADVLVDTVRRVLDSCRPEEIRLDCAALDLCDSSGLSALLMVLRHCDAEGARVRLINPSEGLDRVLAVTGTAPLFGAVTAPSPAWPEPLEELAPAVRSKR